MAIGDEVYAYDAETGEAILAKVTDISVSETNELVHLTINGELIRTTASHPFYTTSGEWKAAGDLTVGDRIVTMTGKAMVEATEVEKLSEAVTVYNLTVEGEHNYYVAENGVLVHNMCQVADSANNGKNASGTVETPIETGTSRPKESGTPNSVYEQMNPDGTVRSRAFYDENGNQFNRQDFDHKHYNKQDQQYYQPHEHGYHYNSDGYRDGVSDGPLTPGYNNNPTR